MYSEREVKRKQIHLLNARGMSVAAMAKVVGVDYKVAKKWSNCDTIKHHYNTVQRKKLTPNTKRKITIELKDKVGASVRKCVRKLNMSDVYKNRNKTISRKAVQNYLKTTNWGKIGRKLKVKPLLSKKNVNDRVRFGLWVKLNGYLDDSRHGITLRENILWTDESPIELHPKPNKQNTRVRTSNKSLAVIRRPKFPLKLCSRAVSLHRV